MSTAARHGTLAGYRAHRRADEDPCTACYRAKSDYDANRRATDEAVRRKSRARARAQRRALTRLVGMYPDLYASLYQDEKTRDVDAS